MPWLTRAVQETMRSGRAFNGPRGLTAPQARPVEPTAGRADPPLPRNDGETLNLVCGVAGPTEGVRAINPSGILMQRSAHHSAGVTWIAAYPPRRPCCRNTETISKAPKGRHPGDRRWSCGGEDLPAQPGCV